MKGYMLKCPNDLKDLFLQDNYQKLIKQCPFPINFDSLYLSEELIQDMYIQRNPKYAKTITDEEIAEWKEGEKILNSINFKEARERVKIEHIEENIFETPFDELFEKHGEKIAI